MVVSRLKLIIGALGFNLDRLSQIHPPLRGTILLDYCWVCSLPSSLEEHHVVPRSYGGTNGPTVTLCGVCHTGVHNLSFKRFLFDGTLPPEKTNNIAKKFCDSWKNPTHGYPDVAAERAVYLGSVILRSRLLVKNEKNKPVKFSTTLPGDISYKLKKLKKAYGDITQEEMIFAAIEELFEIRIGSINIKE